MILLLETATAVCSTALVEKGATLALRRSDVPNAHSSKLPCFVNEMFDEAGATPSDLEAVCVSAGPGSYTGLRIGVSSAKGFCYALGIPLLSVLTTENMAAWYFLRHPEYKGLVCPMIDARRMECYTAMYARGLEGAELCVRKPVSADIVDEGLYDAYLAKDEVVFLGDGAAKTKPLLATHANARYDDEFQISAEGMAAIAEERLHGGCHEDVAYFEPFYLKDFVAKKSVVRGLK